MVLGAGGTEWKGDVCFAINSYGCMVVSVWKEVVSRLGVVMLISQW